MPVNSADLEAAIRKAIAVSHIEVEDQSSGCGESYAVVIVSETFRGKSTLARHRMVNDLLRNEIAQLHAFSQKTFTPEQYQSHLASTEGSVYSA
ncbi:hypothetical protein M378DRAFT_170812 [Amanita muscaria Koide BX008]|uniref:Bola-like protein n=1 Tax=Amanita muscaria (strain Koide BX008) TaxID=946122 RepID=A0A0C2WAK2_AMAMK|nr:hypothetical protein M378DRAFT_170812 [Amanita muscaria Koide BX008]